MTDKRQYSHADLVSMLESRRAGRSISEFAEEVRISPPMLSNILCGHRRADGTQVLRYLGMRRVVAYERA